MELKLNIYEKREIKKTYTADTYDLMFGTVEDFLDLVKIDDMKSLDDKELIRVVGTALSGGLPLVKNLLKDIFEDLTDEDLKNTKLKDITRLLIEIIKYSINEIGKGYNGKN